MRLPPFKGTKGNEPKSYWKEFPTKGTKLLESNVQDKEELKDWLAHR